MEHSEALQMTQDVDVAYLKSCTPRLSTRVSRREEPWQYI